LRREGWSVNKKRVHRLWRKEGLKVPHKQRKRRRLLGDVSENGCTRKRAEHKDHLWSYDFVMDRTDDGRRLKMLAIVDEYTRECLSIEAERTITARDVVKVLAKLFEKRGEPALIRSDNGPEFVAKVVKRWLEASGVETLYIEPRLSVGERLLLRDVHRALWRRAAKEGGVCQSAGSKGAGRRLHRNHYNQRRPHSALGYRTPAEFAASCGSASVEMALTKELQSVTTLS